jgi:4-hydroxy-3-polyprenylbenzoate decarboxylase
LTEFSNRRIVVGVSGASGAIYADRLVYHLLRLGHQVDLVVSPLGVELMRTELDLPSGVPCRKFLLDRHPDLAEPGNLREWKIDNLAAPISSGTALTSGMVVVPCSMKTVGSIASGVSANLIERAADVTMKEGRTLVLVPRETPFNAVHLENMLRLARAGVAILPANPAFYLRPSTFEDLGDFLAAKILDRLGIAHRVIRRWAERDSEER